MKDSWDYTGLKTLNRGRPVSFLCSLSDKLFEWTRDMTEKYDEFPVPYTEWTLVGHMNMVADRCDYMPYAEYVVKLVKGKRGSPAGTARPDLDVHTRYWEDSWIFEAKKSFISLLTRPDLEDRILTRMTQNCDKLQRIVMGSNEVLADNICSAVAFTVWVDAYVTGKTNRVTDRWNRRWRTAKQYHEDWDALLRAFRVALDRVNNQRSRFGTPYYSGYRMPYSLVRKHYEMGLQQVNRGLQPEIRMPVAMLWVFAHKRWPKRTIKRA